MNREEAKHYILMRRALDLNGIEARLLFGENCPRRIAYEEMDDFEFLVDRVLDLRFPGEYSDHDKRFLKSVRITP